MKSYMEVQITKQKIGAVYWLKGSGIPRALPIELLIFKSPRPRAPSPVWLPGGSPSDPFSWAPRWTGCAQEQKRTRLQIPREVRGAGVPRPPSPVQSAFWTVSIPSSVRCSDVFQYNVCSQMLVGNAGLGSFFNVGLLKIFQCIKMHCRSQKWGAE